MHQIEGYFGAALGDEVRRLPAKQDVSPAHPPLWPAYVVAMSQAPKKLYAQCLTEVPPCRANMCAKPDAIAVLGVAVAVPAAS
jgi:hypothetical protein